MSFKYGAIVKRVHLRTAQDGWTAGGDLMRDPDGQPWSHAWLMCVCRLAREKVIKVYIRGNRKEVERIEEVNYLVLFKGN